MEVLTYVPSNVTLLVSGYRIEGWTNISITPNTQSFRQVRGIHGKNTRVRMNDTSAILTIETLQTELLNDVFSMVHIADRAQGTARLEVSLADITGNSFFSSATAYITGMPTLTYGEDVSLVTWTMVCDSSELFLGSARNAAVGVVENGVARLKDFVTDIGNSVSSVFN